MLNMEVLEISIGLLFVYLILSLLATVLNEILATLFKFRAGNLAKAVERILDDDGDSASSNAFYKHPQIKYLGKGKLFPKPSYINPKTFSKVVLDMIKAEGGYDGVVDKMDNSIHNLSDALEKSPFSNETKKLLMSYATDAKNDITKFKENVEELFDETMERAKGWYNRKVKVVSLIVGLAIAIGINADTIAIVKKLSSDSEARKRMVEVAVNYVDKNKITDSTQVVSANITDLNDRLDSLQAKAYEIINDDLNESANILNLGWSDTNNLATIYSGSDWGWLIRFFGWLATALAISIGAPFWFDMLSKLIKIRGTGSSK